MEEKCPNCKSENVFFNGTLYTCISCQYEWVGNAPDNLDDIRQSLREEDKRKKLAGY